VSRRSKTGALPGLLQEANPKQGGESICDALNKQQHICTCQFQLFTSQFYFREAISPLAGNCVQKQNNLNSQQTMKSLSRLAQTGEPMQ